MAERVPETSEEASEPVKLASEPVKLASEPEVVTCGRSTPEIFIYDKETKYEKFHHEIMENRRVVMENLHKLHCDHLCEKEDHYAHQRKSVMEQKLHQKYFKRYPTEVTKLEDRHIAPGEDSTKFNHLDVHVFDVQHHVGKAIARIGKTVSNDVSIRGIVDSNKFLFTDIKRCHIEKVDESIQDFHERYESLKPKELTLAESKRGLEEEHRRSSEKKDGDASEDKDREALEDKDKDASEDKDRDASEGKYRDVSENEDRGSPKSPDLLHSESLSYCQAPEQESVPAVPFLEGMDDDSLTKQLEEFLEVLPSMNPQSKPLLAEFDHLLKEIDELLEYQPSSDENSLCGEDEPCDLPVE